MFISEIFPNRHRAQGQTLGSSTHWIFAALLTTLFPKDGRRPFLPVMCFSFFCGHDGAAIDLGENDGAGNKRVPLEQMQKRLGIEQG